MQQALPAIHRLGGLAVAASADPLSESISLSHQLGLGFPVLSDPSGALGQAFGVFNLSGGMYMGQVDRHSMFIVGPHGHIRWHQLSLVRMSIPMSTVLAALNRLTKVAP